MDLVHLAGTLDCRLDSTQAVRKVRVWIRAPNPDPVPKAISRKIPKFIFLLNIIESSSRHAHKFKILWSILMSTSEIQKFELEIGQPSLASSNQNCFYKISLKFRYQVI